MISDTVCQQTSGIAWTFYILLFQMCSWAICSHKMQVGQA